MQNKDNNQKNRNQVQRQDKNQMNRNQVQKQDDNLFQFEMGNELGANIEQEKTMFKNEYEKDKLKRKNNNFSTNKNQMK